jgi:hypothetical protein
MTTDGIGNFRFWFKVDFCFTVMSYDGLVNYLMLDNG